MKGIHFSVFHQNLAVATEKCSDQISVTGMFRGLEYPYFMYTFIGKMLLFKNKQTNNFASWYFSKGTNDRGFSGLG